MPEPIRMRFFGGERTIFKRDAALVRIQTDRGLVGYAPAPASERTIEAIRTTLRPKLLGSDPIRTDDLARQALDGASPSVVQAFGAVQIALYDLRGKIEGRPVCDLLGGRVRDHIRLYGSAGMYQPPEGYAAEAAAVAALGFSAFKMRPALGPENDLRTVELMRQAAGPHLGLCVDAHAWWRMGDRSYTPARIEQLAREMAPYGVTWLEEPLPPEDRDAYARLRRARIVPVAAGEHETSLEGFLEIIHREAVDIVQADVAHHGGYRIVGKVLGACGRHGRQFAFHSWGTLLEIVADAHLGVCFPEQVCAWLEYPCYSHRGQNIMYPYPLADEILKNPLRIEKGDLLLPTGPGLGVEVDESVIERYPYIPGPWSVFRLASPPEEWALSGDHIVKWESGKSR
ncbi:MAG: mandelate racemase/muconate lactonizing enzyme family protein [Planctomycetes bacterium]|nr:mandelate racemase/muconate lactonizing enzyme family protein [Planctomycetota bacterium]